MKYLLLIYNDDALLDALPAGEADAMMRGCLDHADELTEQGCLIDSQQLEPPATAKSVRVRHGRVSVVDGPFAETKEMLGGFNLIEAPISTRRSASRPNFRGRAPVVSNSGNARYHRGAPSCWRGYRRSAPRIVRIHRDDASSSQPRRRTAGSPRSRNGSVRHPAARAPEPPP